MIGLNLNDVIFTGLIGQTIREHERAKMIAVNSTVVFVRILFALSSAKVLVFFEAYDKI